ncbi:MAG: hypothetical protein EXQ96_00220 [Alphaproteobacteria bacterium]|nr:hypothetical protein [Alphaproteobacteria bacterium]
MEAAKHRESAERIGRTMAKLGAADHEMVIEGAMLAATQWINYALHQARVTPPKEDVQHTYFLTGNQWRRYGVAVEDMLRALDEIENIRPMYVRGDVAGADAAAARARALLEQVRQQALEAKPIR